MLGLGKIFCAINMLVDIIGIIAAFFMFEGGILVAVLIALIINILFDLVMIAIIDECEWVDINKESISNCIKNMNRLMSNNLAINSVSADKIKNTPTQQVSPNKEYVNNQNYANNQYDVNAFKHTDSTALEYPDSQCLKCCKYTTIWQSNCIVYGNHRDRPVDIISNKAACRQFVQR